MFLTIQRELLRPMPTEFLRGRRVGLSLYRCIRFVQFPWGGCFDRCIRNPGRGIRLIGYGCALLKQFPESVDGLGGKETVHKLRPTEVIEGGLKWVNGTGDMGKN